MAETEAARRSERERLEAVPSLARGSIGRGMRGSERSEEEKLDERWNREMLARDDAERLEHNHPAAERLEAESLEAERLEHERLRAKCLETERL